MFGEGVVEVLLVDQGDHLRVAGFDEVLALQATELTHEFKPHLEGRLATALHSQFVEPMEGPTQQVHILTPNFGTHRTQTHI